MIKRRRDIGSRQSTFVGAGQQGRGVGIADGLSSPAPRDRRLPAALHPAPPAREAFGRLRFNLPWDCLLLWTIKFSRRQTKSAPRFIVSTRSTAPKTRLASE